MPIDWLVDHLVDDRCPADPCASKNGLKLRVYAVVLFPTLAIGVVSVALSSGSLLARVLFGLAAAWFIGSLLVIPRKISELESCDEVNSHYSDE